jgi:hypothetical protein
MHKTSLDVGDMMDCIFRHTQILGEHTAVDCYLK